MLDRFIKQTSVYKQLLAEYERIKTVNESLLDPKIMSLNIEHGRIDLTIDSPFTRILGAFCCKTIKDSNAKNYVEIQVTYDNEPYIMTVQRQLGKTPHQLRVEAENKLKELQDA